MGRIFGNLNLALALGIVLLLATMFGLHGDAMGEGDYAHWWLRFFHVIAGVLWIGLLYYFNMVQIPTMPKVPAELKGGVSKYIAPEALFWFRWSALATVILGVALAETNPTGRYLMPALAFEQGYRVIGLGMWLGLIMAANVWFVIWPNQKKALGLKPADDEAKAKSARTAMIASRINFVLSIPMLYCMVTQFYLPE
ncbi:urate hydroxylase PuuD [Enterovirga sp. GCM10030262]|uniref:urate hydroxylase PuuD n=1 Tax=Enterovirga sp. GCM10030262 TaxID=3273391 RepID=UPI00360EBB2E